MLSFDKTYTYLYVPEWSAARVRRISMSSGLVFTHAGTGTGGFTGDGGQATSGRVNVPAKIVFDSLGGYYIADRSNNRIRYVSNQGIISTFAGTGTRAFTQDNLGPLNTNLNFPTSLALDRFGYVVIVDTSNFRIRGVFQSAPTNLPTLAPTVTAVTSYVQTIYGTGSASNPVDAQNAKTNPIGLVRDLVFDSSNNLYYAETNTATVRVVYAATGLGYTFAGTYLTSANTGHNDLATSPASALVSPYGLNFDINGNLLITDTGAHTVRLVTMSTKIMSRVAGTGVAGYNQDGIFPTAATLNDPYSALTDGNGNIYINDFSNCRIRVISASDKKIRTFAGTGVVGSGDDGYSATSTAIYYPSRGAFGPGFFNLYYTEWSGQRVRAISMTTLLVKTVAGNGAYGFGGDGGPATSANIYTPSKVAFDSNGGFYIADYSNHRVRYVSNTGFINTVLGTGGATYNGDSLSPLATALHTPNAVAVDRTGNLFVADTNNYRIRTIVTKFPTGTPTLAPSVDTSVTLLQTVVGNGVTSTVIENANATLSPGGYARDLVFDSSNNLYYADYQSYTIRVVAVGTGRNVLVAGKLNILGNADGALGTGAMGSPFGISIDNSGNVLVAEHNYHTIRKVTLPTKALSTVAGTGVAGYSGDLLPATSSALNEPWVAVTDASGNIYITDYINCRIRRVVLSTGQLVNFAGTGSCAAGVDGLQATATGLLNPGRIAFNADYSFLYYPEYGGSTLRRINMATGLTTIVISSDAAYPSVYSPVPLVGAIDLAFDRSGGILIANRNRHSITYLTPGGVHVKYAGTGGAGYSQDGLTASSSPFNRPEGVAIDSNGYVYIADANNYRIRKIINTRLFL